MSPLISSGTRRPLGWINHDVPQEVVRRLLDHTSHTMTAVYARLADTTIREQWERAQKINIRGEPVDTTATDRSPTPSG